MADEATDAADTTEAGKADVANKPGDVDEAKADEANEAKDNEADAEANETIEAIVTEEIEANELSSGQGQQAHEAGNAEVVEAYEA